MLTEVKGEKWNFNCLLIFFGGLLNSEKYDDNSVQLSGGEKQRVALARAFLKAPPIL